MKEIVKHLTFSLRPLVRLTDPRKTSVPCHVQCIKITQIGLLAGQPPGTHDRGRSSKKAIRLDLSVRQCNDVPITKKGFSPAWILDHRCNAKLMQNQLFVKRHLISHNVVAKPPVTDRTILCDGRCLLDDYHEVHNKIRHKKVCMSHCLIYKILCLSCSMVFWGRIPISDFTRPSLKLLRCTFEIGILGRVELC